MKIRRSVYTIFVTVNSLLSLSSLSGRRTSSLLCARAYTTPSTCLFTIMRLVTLLTIVAHIHCTYTVNSEDHFQTTVDSHPPTQATQQPTPFFRPTPNHRWYPVQTARKDASQTEQQQSTRVLRTRLPRKETAQDLDDSKTPSRRYFLNRD